MKALLYSNPKTETESFHVQVDEMAHFYDSLHYHPEVQVTLILRGTGTLFVGDCIEQFKPGDLIVIGANLPHVLRCDAEYYENDPEMKAHGISLYFKPEAFGDHFFQLPETRHISEWIRKISRGIRVAPSDTTLIDELIRLMPELEGFERFRALLSILHHLTRAHNFDYLSSVSFTTPQKDTDSKKINNVFDYVMLNFPREIRLDTVAEVAHMSPTAFCRYFKQRTRKTFSRFLNEVRIGNACKLLLEGDNTVTEVSFNCGYNNISNFNRQFKAISKFTPSEYVRKYRETEKITT
jgi:AraC-like DNA-binding protein